MAAGLGDALGLSDPWASAIPGYKDSNFLPARHR